MSSRSMERKPFGASLRAALSIRAARRDIGQALALLVLREELLTGVGRVAGTGGVENFFDVLER